MRYLMLALLLACRNDKPAHTATGDSGNRDDSATPADPLRDTDGDGTPDSGDCAPQDPTIGPNLAEIEGDGTDQNCDGLDRSVTDLRGLGIQVWGEGVAFAVALEVLQVGDQGAALIGQPIVDDAGRVHVLFHPDEPMFTLSLDDGGSMPDDHIGWTVTHAVVEGQTVVLAPSDFASGEQSLVGWPLEGLTSNLGPEEVWFNLPLQTERRMAANPPLYGPDVTGDGRSDLLLIEGRALDDILQVWPGPVSLGSLAEPPLRVSLPLGLVRALEIRSLRSQGHPPAYSIVEWEDFVPTWVHFMDDGIETLAVDIRSAADGSRPIAEQADLNGDGVLERCIADGYWISDSGVVGAVGCFSSATAGTIALGEADMIMLGEADASFGASFAAADLDGDGRDELVVGAPTVRVGGRAGLVYVLKEVDGALVRHATFSDFAVEALFGADVGVADLDGDARLDVITTAQRSCFNGAATHEEDGTCPGAVWVIPGSAGLW